MLAVARRAGAAAWCRAAAARHPAASAVPAAGARWVSDVPSEPKVAQLTRGASASGLLTLYLPTQGPTVFSIEPALTVRRFTDGLREEYGSLRSARVFDFEGDPVAGSVRMSSLATQGFQVMVDGTVVVVEPVEEELFSAEELRDAQIETLLSEVRTLKEEAAAAAEASAEKDVDVEREIAVYEAALSEAERELSTFDPIVERLEAKYRWRRRRFWMAALAAMSVQWGFLAELTFNQFSWDLMEPITFFLTQATTMALVAFSIVTQTSPEFDGLSERTRAITWAKEAPREGFSVERYDSVRSSVSALRDRVNLLRAMSATAAGSADTTTKGDGESNAQQ